MQRIDHPEDLRRHRSLYDFKRPRHPTATARCVGSRAGLTTAPPPHRPLDSQHSELKRENKKILGSKPKDGKFSSF